MVLTLFSCSANECKETEKNTDTEKSTNITNSINRDGGKDYQIIQVEDGYRLVFDNPSFYAKCESPQIVGFTIDSWEDFSDRLLAGALTLDEKISLYYTSSKDEEGIIILDPYVSYKISHFLPYQINNVGLYAGVYYHSSITCDEQYTLPISIAILSKPLYDSDFDAAFSDIDIGEKNIEYEEIISLQLTFEWWYKRIYFRNCAIIDQSDFVVFYVINKENSGANKSMLYADKKKKRYVNFICVCAFFFLGLFYLGKAGIIRFRIFNSFSNGIMIMNTLFLAYAIIENIFFTTKYIFTDWCSKNNRAYKHEIHLLLSHTR